MKKAENCGDAEKEGEEGEEEELSRLEQQFEAIQAMKEQQLLLIGEINFPHQIELVQLYESVFHLLLLKHDKILQTCPSYQSESPCCIRLYIIL